MSNFNNVVLVGRLTRDPELRKTGNDIDVANFGIAVNRNFKEDEVDFFDVTVWRGLATTVAAHKVKGDLVLVSGELRTDNFEKDGQKRSKTYVVGNTVRYLSSKGQGNSAPVEDDDIPF